MVLPFPFFIFLLSRLPSQSCSFFHTYLCQRQVTYELKEIIEINQSRSIWVQNRRQSVDRTLTFR